MSGAVVLTAAQGTAVGPASGVRGREGMVVRRCAVHHGQCPCRWLEGFPGDLLVDLQLAEGQVLHVRLAYALRRAIQSGRLVAGATLPPSRVLATELGMSRSVVVTAYTNLEADDGWVHYVSDAATAMREAKAAAGDQDVQVHGAALAQSLLREGLLDELEIHLIPFVLGGGRRLFGEDRIEFELTRVLDAPGVTHLHYRVAS